MSAAQATHRLRRIGLRSAQVFAGLIVGLGLAEVAASSRQHGAFPHLNVYVADAKLGVRLLPGATQKVEFGGNPVTEVRINADGFRGANLRQRGAHEPGDDVMVVGDSQVFGLGVQEGETFSAALASRTGKTVFNAGVPTYGPLEFQALLEEQLPKRKPRVVIYVVNMANDLMEANRPNAARHAVWDGWAVRRETMPASFVDFPGRAIAFRRSHLVFALRRALHGNHEGDDRALPSEGTWQDLVVAANATTHAKSTAEDAQLAQWEADVKATVDAATAAQKKLQTTGQSAFPEVFEGPAGKEYLKKNGHPGDIVSEKVYLSEATFGPETRVKIALDGAKIRREIEDLLKKRAEEEIEKAESKAILASLDERTKLEKRIAELRVLPAKILRTHSPLFPALEKVKKLCDAHGARLVVAILPMDVQVSVAEWSKYGESPIDLTPTRVLTDDIVHAGEALGVTVIDLTPALVAAEPGAFLLRDLHMSPKGHAAVAVALQTNLDKPPPVAASIAPGPAIGFTKVCACHKKAAHASCDDVSKTPDVDCLRTYSSDCAKLLACVHGDPKHAPKCLPGWANHGVHHRCYQSCSTEKTCNAGACTKVKEGHLCI